MGRDWTFSRGAAKLSATALVLLSTAATAVAEEQYLRVYMDHARVLKLDRAVSKVIVGNAKVADATVAPSAWIVNGMR